MNMKKSLLILAAVFAAAPLLAEKNDKMEPWQDPGVFEENRLPMAATFVTDQQKTLTLNGVWKFKWNETIEGREKGFEAVGYDDSGWGTIPVPGMWELNGYNDPLYLNVGYAWRGHYGNNPPYPPTEHNYVGQYRRLFDVDKSWIGKQICLCIGSATSNVRVWVNGKMVGYSEDSKLEARFDITRYVKAGENLIALEVFRWCDGSYLEDQDFWRLSGIARGVYVYTREKERIEDVNIVAGMDGDFTVKAKVTKGVRSLHVAVIDKDGNQVAYRDATPVKGQATLSGVVQNPALWSAEIPNLYTLKVTAFDKRDVVESASVDFGFRTVEIRNSQLLVNGQPILIKGANRHEVSADKGYVVSEEDMIRDIRIMKELNMNAVRTCHYPDDPRWYALCDKYGLYVVDEGNIESHGMGYGEETLAARADFKAAHLSRDQRMLRRDFNHPSVIIWSLGNEAGFGDNFIAGYNWMKENDPSRPVQYERADGDGLLFDIICPMYWSPQRCEETVKSNPGKPLIQCEYAHAMGNSMGNFKEYWDIIRKYPAYQGGFIWDFVDQAIRWPSKEGGTDHIFAFGGDFNEYDPSDGSFNCNGVIAADRTLHPHAYEVRYQHRNILTSLAGQGRVNVYNEHFFKDLSQYRMLWDITVDGIAVSSGVVESLDVAPQATATVDLGFRELPEADADIFLNVSYVLKTPDGLLPAGSEVAYDQIPLREKAAAAFKAGSAAAGGLNLAETAGAYVFSGSFAFAGTAADRVSDWTATFDKATGFLTDYTVDGVRMISEPLTPEFARAPIENDMGAGMIHELYRTWRYLTFNLKSLKVGRPAGSDAAMSLTAEYEPVAGGAAIVEMSYEIFPDGAVRATERMRDGGGLAKAPALMRFGMKLAMPGRFSTVDFYGKGPWENYSDRNSGAIVGHYTQSVNEQYHYGYVRSQESGTKTGLRYFRLLDSNGTGLEITADERFSASALPFSMRDLDCMENGTPDRANKTNTQNGAPRHSLNLKAKAHENDRANGTTYVNFDLVQMGVGGINSWGTLPLSQYMIPAAERAFTFVIRPVNN